MAWLAQADMEPGGSGVAEAISGCAAAQSGCQRVPRRQQRMCRLNSGAAGGVGGGRVRTHLVIKLPRRCRVWVAAEVKDPEGVGQRAHTARQPGGEAKWSQAG